MTHTYPHTGYYDIIHNCIISISHSSTSACIHHRTQHLISGFLVARFHVFSLLFLSTDDTTSSMAIRRTLWKAFTAAIATTTPSPPPLLRGQEIQLSCSDGTKLAAQFFSSRDSTNASSSAATNPRTVVCLHGWMDNCRSFHYLAPYLAAKDDRFQVVALDLPGHGRSSHKSLDAPPVVMAEMAYYVSEAMDSLQREGYHSTTATTKMTLVGHSLGAGIASLVAASCPEQVDQLVLLDGIGGFLPREAKDTALHVRNHIKRRKMALAKQQKKQNEQDESSSSTRRGYPSLQAAIERRLQSVKSMPGNQTLSYEAAKQIVLRGTHLDLLDDHDDDDDDGSMDENDNGGLIQFRHDPRFAWPSIQYMTQAQNEGIYQTLREGVEGNRVDCCVLLAKDGWPFQNDILERARSLLQPRVCHILPGSHFFHSDPETSEEVATAVLEFISNPLAAVEDESSSNHPTSLTS